jgi:DNA-binding CsgD family transcriptional regulator
MMAHTVLDAEFLAVAQGLSQDGDGQTLVMVEPGGNLWTEGGIDVSDGARARAVSARLPPWLQAHMSPRLDRLSLEAWQLLEVAAVLGRSFSVDEVAEALGKQVGQLLLPLREVLDAGVIAPAADALVFRSDLIRQAVYRALPEPVQLALHRHIGGLLLDRGGLAVPAANHLIRGARPGDRQDLLGLDRAVLEVLLSAPQSAVELALRALEFTEPTSADRFSRTVTAVNALVTAGQLVQGTELARSVLDHPGLPAVSAAQLRLMLSSVLLMNGRPLEAEAEAAAVLAEPGLPNELYAGAELARLLDVLVRNDLCLLRERAEAILAGGDRCGGDTVLAGALAALAFIAWEEGRVADALGLLRAAVRRGDRGPLKTSRPSPRMRLATWLTAVGEFDEADAAITECRQEIELVGDTVWAAAPAIFRSRLHLAAGRLDDALTEAQAGLATAEKLGTRLFIPMALWVVASVAVLRGDLDEAAQQIKRYRAEPFSGRVLLGPTAHAFLEARLGDAREGPAGGPARAVEVLAGVYGDLPSHKRLFIEEPAAAAWLVRAALAAGDRSRAEAVVICAEQLASDNRGFPSVAAAAAHARGVLDRDVAALEQAGADYRHPWARASALEDAGVVLAHADHTTAGARLEQSLVGYEQAGADHDAARVRARLRDLGVRRRHRRHAERPVSGWASLTDAERRVADVVAEGLTNVKAAERLFLSPHTVDFHLRHIFRKLGIGSRVELTRLVLDPTRVR